MAYTPEQLAVLEAQRAWFASDDHIRREVGVWADTTPTERLRELAEMCRAAEHYLTQHEPDTTIDVERRYPADTIAIWAALRRAAR